MLAPLQLGQATATADADALATPPRSSVDGRAEHQGETYGEISKMDDGSCWWDIARVCSVEASTWTPWTSNVQVFHSATCVPGQLPARLTVHI
jgi:hypothetical protein